MRHFFICALVTLPAATPALAEPGCASVSGGQFYDQLSYCAWSSLAPQSGNDYGPDNLGDGDLRTAWCENAPGHGEGQAIAMVITGGSEFTELAIHSGYQKSQSTYQKNSRPRDLRLTSWDGVDMVVTLADRMGEQRIRLPRAFAYSQIQLEILSVYPGSKWSDTCITELHADFEARNFAAPQPGGGGGISKGTGTPKGFDSFPKLLE